MSEKYRRNTPAEVTRTLRQEAGFGCAQCGHPFVEYHHIVPYAEEVHFRTDDMVALCGNCHASIGKLPRDRQYAIKKNPFNIENGLSKGALVYDKRDLKFEVGGNYFVNTRTILQFCGIPIVACKLDDGQAKVTLNLLNKKREPILSIEDNEIILRVGDLWDFEYQHNYVKARYGDRDIALELDFRENVASIRAKLWFGDTLADINSKSISIGTSKFVGNTFSNCNFAIDIGDNGSMSIGG